MKHTTMMLAVPLALIAIASPSPVDAGGYVGVGISNHGLSVGFGASNWGIWGSSWGTGSVSVGFTATLSGYGEWVHVGGLGRVWRPWVAAGWQPYSHGRWVWTSMGWTWVAYEPWGWVPHHYGNWAFTTIGWVWSPGYVYHPGNVVWVSSGVHIGWVPCAPYGWSHSNRGYHHGWHDGYRTGYADGWRDARYATWVPRSHVGSANISTHAVRHEDAIRGVPRSRVTALKSAPTRHEIERQAGRAVPEARIAETRATVDGRDIRIVRPEGQAENVRRHGGATVERALAPAARERASSGSNRATRTTSSADPKAERRSRSGSVTPDVREPVSTRDRGSARSVPNRSGSTKERSTGTVGGSREARPTKAYQPSSVQRREVESSGSRRTKSGTVATSKSSRSRTVSQTAPRSGSATRGTTEPSVNRASSSRKTITVSSDPKRKAEPRKNNETESKSRRSRRTRN